MHLIPVYYLAPSKRLRPENSLVLGLRRGKEFFSVREFGASRSELPRRTSSSYSARSSEKKGYSRGEKERR
jgi:hypothetical protein